MHSLPSPYRRSDAARYIATKRARVRNRESIALALTLNRQRTLVGMIELSHLSTKDRFAELEYWISPAYRGQGYATEAARAMCRMAFRTLRLHRVEAGALARNRASIRVLEKAGLRHEGRSRDRIRTGGRRVDQVRLARIGR